MTTYTKWRRKPAFNKEVIGRIILLTFHIVLKTKDAKFRYRINAFQKHSNRKNLYLYDNTLIYDTSSVYKAGITTENYVLGFLPEEKKIDDRVNFIAGSFNYKVSAAGNLCPL